MLSEYETRYANDPEYFAETAAVAVLEQAAQRMAKTGVSQAQLAERIGWPLVTVQRLFDGNPRLISIRALAQVAVALGMRLEMALI